jgi:hypothetical protein
VSAYLLAETWDAWEPEAYENAGTNWWANCDKCSWCGPERQSKSWASRDAHAHDIDPAHCAKKETG